MRTALVLLFLGLVIGLPVASHRRQPIVTKVLCCGPNSQPAFCPPHGC
jgi:hypothetical protein